MIQKTVGDIDREIDVLIKRIQVLQDERFLLRNSPSLSSNAWRRTCNLYINDECTDEYGD